MDHHRSDSSDDSGASDQSIDHPPLFNKMDHYRSDCSDDSGASEHSIERPPSFNRNLNLELKRSLEELKSEFDRNHQTLIGQIKKLNDITDEVESVHKNATVGRLVGSSIGAVGGIAFIAGLVLAPFTLGASLALTGVGVAAGVAGGLTGATSNITNMIKQKNLRETIEKIINDFQNTVKPMIELLSEIYNITEDIKLKEQTLNKHEIQRAARGAVDVLKIVKVANVAEIGQMRAEAAKEIRVFVKAVKAVRGSAEAAKAMRGSAEAAKAKRKEEEIKSETLKFILYMRETTAQFKKIVDKIKDTIDTFF